MYDGEVTLSTSGREMDDEPASVVSGKTTLTACSLFTVMGTLGGIRPCGITIVQLYLWHSRVRS